MKTIEEIKTLVAQRDKINGEIERFVDSHSAALKRYLGDTRVDVYGLTVQEVATDSLLLEGRDHNGDIDGWNVPRELFTDPDAWFAKEEARQAAAEEARRQKQIERHKTRADALRREWEKVEDEIAALERSAS